jgi:protoheme IX farnesyltransferase
MFLILALRVFRVREGKDAAKAAKELFAFSILYLFILFAVLLGEAMFGAWSI